MIEHKPVTSQLKIWRLGKDGFVSDTATLYEGRSGSQIIYDHPIPEKDYSPKCDVCLVQEQGYGCERLVTDPGPYEFEGGCMDCKYRCNKPPVHIGVRNYCEGHMPIMNKKLGVRRNENA